MAYLLICTNGSISGSELRQHHVGRGIDPADDGASGFYRDETCRAGERAFWLKVVDTVDAAMNEALFGQLVDKLRVAAGEPLDAKPSEIVEVVARRLGLTEVEQDGVLHQLALGADCTRQCGDTYRGRFRNLRPRGRARAHRWVLDRSQAKRLIHAAKGQTRVLVLLAATLGMREGRAVWPCLGFRGLQATHSDGGTAAL